MAYDPRFIEGMEVPLPQLRPAAQQAAYDDGRVFEHSRYSFVFNQERGMATYTAHNIDGANRLPEGTIERDDDFRPDPLLDAGLQINDLRGYRNNPWDRGHLVRRASMHWGDLDAAKLGDSESYFWTNITPQHNQLHHGAWGKIEEWMVGKADNYREKVCVFTGPIFTPYDVLHKNRDDQEPIYIPAGFWKILAISYQYRLKAAGFLVWQVDFERESPVAFDPHLEQVRITTLEYILGLTFGPLPAADPLRFEPDDRHALAAPGPRTDGFVMSSQDIVI